MGKRKPALSDDRMRDVWNVRGLDYGEAELANFEKLICSAVSRCLAEDPSNREEIAGHLSYILGEEVSVAMLDAYASEARQEHKIHASRFLALIAMTKRFDILDAVLREVGGKAVDWHGAKVLRVGYDFLGSVRANRDLRESLAEVIAPERQ